MTIRVLLADDHAAIRAGLAMILNGDGDIKVIAEAAAVRKAALRPDVVLMDVRMPGTYGIEATRQLVSQQITQVLGLTTFDLRSRVQAAMVARDSKLTLP